MNRIYEGVEIMIFKERKLHVFLNMKERYTGYWMSQ